MAQSISDETQSMEAADKARLERIDLFRALLEGYSIGPARRILTWDMVDIDGKHVDCDYGRWVHYPDRIVLECLNGKRRPDVTIHYHLIIDMTFGPSNLKIRVLPEWIRRKAEFGR